MKHIDIYLPYAFVVNHSEIVENNRYFATKITKNPIIRKKNTIFLVHNAECIIAASLHLSLADVPEGASLHFLFLCSSV